MIRYSEKVNLALGMSKVNLLKLQTLWYLAAIASVLWFLYWICYDIVVWNKLLVEVNLLNYVGAILSLAFIFAGSRLRKIKSIIEASKENGGYANVEGQVNISEQNDMEKKVNVEEQSNREEESSLALQELKKEEASLTEEKRDLLASKERLRAKINEEIENAKHRIEALRSEISELQHQCEEIKNSLSY